MCMLFDELRAKIHQYCDDNNLDFNIAEGLSQSWNKDTVVLYHCEKDNSSKGLLQDTPSPMVLMIKKKKNGEVVFEQTEHTMKYLGKVS